MLSVTIQMGWAKTKMSGLAKEMRKIIPPTYVGVANVDGGNLVDERSKFQQCSFRTLQNHPRLPSALTMTIFGERLSTVCQPWSQLRARAQLHFAGQSSVCFMHSDLSSFQRTYACTLVLTMRCELWSCVATQSTHHSFHPKTFKSFHRICKPLQTKALHR